MIYWGCENIAIPKSQEEYRNSLFALKNKYKSSDTSAKQMKVIKEREAYDKKNDAMFMDSWIAKITNVYNSFIVCEYDGHKQGLLVMKTQFCQAGGREFKSRRSRSESKHHIPLYKSLA